VATAFGPDRWVVDDVEGRDTAVAVGGPPCVIMGGSKPLLLCCQPRFNKKDAMDGATMGLSGAAASPSNLSFPLSAPLSSTARMPSPTYVLGFPVFTMKPPPGLSASGFRAVAAKASEAFLCGVPAAGDDCGVFPGEMDGPADVELNVDLSRALLTTAADADLVFGFPSVEVAFVFDLLGVRDTPSVVLCILLGVLVVPFV
jgi:hypothetical protein